MRVSVDGKELLLPDFLLVGAARCGTTSLYHYIKQHPDIFLSERKDVDFFAASENGSPCPGFQGAGAPRTLKAYSKLYARASEGQIIGDVSASYLYHHQRTIRNIKKLYGSRYDRLKIIAVLRNPVERAFSHYLQHRKVGIETLPFEEAIRRPVRERRSREHWSYDYVEVGFYRESIGVFLREFPSVRVYLYDEWEEPQKLVRDLLAFLGVDSKQPIDTGVVVNPSGIPRFKTLARLLTGDNRLKRTVRSLISGQARWKLVGLKEKLLQLMLRPGTMSPETRAGLEALYREEILDLQSLLGRDLSSWLGETKT